MATGNNYAGEYFRLGYDISWSTSSSFDPIGTEDCPFSGNFDGNGYEISGLFQEGLFGYIKVLDSDVTICNLNLDFTVYNGSRVIEVGEQYLGNLAQEVHVTGSGNFYTNDITVDQPWEWNTYIIPSVGFNYGGLFGRVEVGCHGGTGRAEIAYCKVNVEVDGMCRASGLMQGAGGLIGMADVGYCDANGSASLRIVGCDIQADLGIISYENPTAGAVRLMAAGGVCAWMTTYGEVEIAHCKHSNVIISVGQDYTKGYSYAKEYIGGYIGWISNKGSIGSVNIHCCDFGKAGVADSGTIWRYRDKEFWQNSTFKSNFVIGGGEYTNEWCTVRNMVRHDDSAFSGWSPDDMSNMTYSNLYFELMDLYDVVTGWCESDPDCWVKKFGMNGGVPYLPRFKDSYSQSITGSGTATDPYVILTGTALKEVAEYLNDGDGVDNAPEYWELGDNVSIGAYDDWEPIGYSGFYGYFDGKDYYVDDLSVKSQWTYAGLFGPIESGSYVKNLSVYGDIYWDQAYGVGGVTGMVESGGLVQDCYFGGNIIGILNTKMTTGCNGVVGIYDEGSVVDCDSYYQEIKYARSFYYYDTYYLADWGYVWVYLYDYYVS